MPGEPTTIYSAANPQQAHLLKGLLEERGITAWVVNDSIQIAGGELPLGWTAAARVVVSDRDAVEARQFALDFERQTAHEPALEEAAQEPPALDWNEWPLCPQCQERRSARCPACASSGTRFPLADIQEAAGSQRVLLYCDACDDHFLPQWYRLCPRCGYDFGEGIEFGPPAARQPLDRRAWLVLAAMAAGAALFVSYFAWLFWR